MPNLGCITEQGDMSLGFTPVTDDEYTKLKENLKEEYEKKSKESNSSNDIDH